MRFTFEHSAAAFRTRAERFLTREIDFWRRFPGCLGRAFFTLCRARLELKTDFAVLTQRQEGLERTAGFFRNEFGQEFRFPDGQQPGNLRLIDRLL